MPTGAANLTSPTFRDSSLSTNAASILNLSPARSLSAGTPSVLPPANSTLYQIIILSALYLIILTVYHPVRLEYIFIPYKGCGHSWKCYILCLYPLIPLLIVIPCSLRNLLILLFLILYFLTKSNIDHSSLYNLMSSFLSISSIVFPFLGL